MQKILAIDDKMDNLVTLSALLKNLMPGCTMITARSGKEGIEKARTELPDAILLDVKMPDMDGFETCRRLKADESTKRIPVIMITAIKTDSQSRIKGLEIGADAFLAKPIDEHELVSQVKVALRIKNAEDALREERDSLERKVQERTVALRESEEKHRLIIENSHDIIYTITPEGVFTFVSPSWTALLGHPITQVVGKQFQQFVHPDDIAGYLAFLQKSIETGQRQTGVEYRVRHADGSWRWHTTNSVPLMDKAGKIIGFEGSASDFTERKQAEEIVQKSEEKFSKAFHSSPILTAISTIEEGRFLDVNEIFLRTLLFSREEVIGKTSLELGFFANPVQHQTIRKITEEKGHAKDVEVKMAAKNGQIIDGLLSAEPITINSEKCWLTVMVDVTEQRRVAEALQKSEERYRTLIETTGDLIYTTDRKGFLTYMNPTLERTLGYIHDEWNGKTFAQIVAPECVDSVKDLFKRAMKGESIPAYETDLIRKGGARLSVEFNVVTIYNSDGNPSGRYGIGRDITDRKQAERALRESENKYRLLADNVNDVIFVLDMNLNYTYISPSVKILRGYEPEEVLKLSASETLTPPSLDLAVRTISEVMELEKSGHRDISISRTLQLEVRRKDGTTVWTEVKISFVRDENQRPVGILGLTRDITDRKQAEEALKKSERNLSDIVEFLPDATFVIDLEGKVIAWNRAIEEMTGILKEEMIGQGDHAYAIPFYGERRRQLLDLIDVSDKELESRYKSVQRKGNTLYAEAFTPALYGGKGAHVWATGASLFDDSGNCVGAIESIRDITEHKKAEDEKQSLEERLNRAEKMEALGTLAGGVAHDLNNVLGVVVGYAELVLMKADESSSIRPQLVNIMNGGLKAAAIVDDLLTLARRGVSDRDVLNLNKIIADCQKSPEFEKLYSYHPSVKIKTDIDPDLPNISGSSVHLGKSLYNLISNASEAMAKGGTVTIRTTNQYLDKPIQGYDKIQEGDYVVLSVSDTGEGISADNLKRIFEPFYTKKVMGRSGTGLGLAVVWGTVKDHHGYINVESEEGKGSTFTLYFPVTREAITADAVAIAISEYMGSGESILVVDDVKEQRDLAAGMLRTLNYNVASVSSGEEAVLYLKEHTVDLMVLDMIMDPGMDGLDTYKQVLGIHPKQRAIIVSGFSETDRVKAARDLGAGAYVRKPYIKEKLGLAVRKELDKHADHE